MTEKQFNLMDAALELESHAGSISLRVETLDDISTNLKHLQADMDKAVYRGTQAISYEENHREVRILAELMYWTMHELIQNQEELKAQVEALVSEAKKDQTIKE